MPFDLATPLKDARLQVIVGALDAGSAGGTIKLYDGNKPAIGAPLANNTLLGTLTLSDPAGVIANGVLTFSAVSDDVSADADGTITWARFADSDGGFVADGDCGVVGSGALLIFNATTVTTGGVIRITAGSLTEG